MRYVRNETAYGLGKRAYKINSEDCDPMEDELFMEFIEQNDTLPLALTISDYVEGWHEVYNKKEREAKVVDIAAWRK
jgi:hypothetical protein